MTLIGSISEVNMLAKNELLETELAELFGGIVERAWGRKMDDMVKSLRGRG